MSFFRVHVDVNTTTEVYVDTKESSDWITVREAADELKIPLTRCYMLIQAGGLPAVRIGERSIRVNRQELERFLLEERRVASAE